MKSTDDAVSNSMGVVTRRSRTVFQLHSTVLESPTLMYQGVTQCHSCVLSGGAQNVIIVRLDPKYRMSSHNKSAFGKTLYKSFCTNTPNYVNNGKLVSQWLWVEIMLCILCAVLFIDLTQQLLEILKNLLV